MAFADTNDVAKRRGPLGEEETAAAEMLLELAQGVVEEAVERDEEAILALKGAIPTVLRLLVIEKVVKAMANPDGLASQSETLGAHSRTERFATTAAGSDLLLTETEERLARKAVHGRLSGTARPESIVSPQRVTQ